jgi:pyruvate dehydrogenase complex dehydrogenase (E1) component
VESITKQVFEKKKNLRMEMKKRGIKSYPRIVIDKEFIDYPFLIRGYEYTQRLWTAAIRKKLNEDYKEYMK